MNIEFWKKHQQTFLAKAKLLLETSHQEVLELVQQFSNEDLFTKGVFAWTGGTSLGSYFISATSSHYNWAIKKTESPPEKTPTALISFPKNEGPQGAFSNFLE